MYEDLQRRIEKLERLTRTLYRADGGALARGLGGDEQAWLGRGQGLGRRFRHPSGCTRGFIAAAGAAAEEHQLKRFPPRLANNPGGRRNISAWG
jgi:hypothetical protein